MRPEEFDELYGSYADGSCSPEDAERLLEAIESDPELLRRFLGERDLEHFLGRMLRPEATESAFLRGVLRDAGAHPLTPQEFEQQVLKKAGVGEDAPVKKAFFPRPFRRRLGRPSGSGGARALLAAGLFIGIVSLVVVLSSGERPETKREAQVRKPVVDAGRLERAQVEVAEAEREQQRMRERLETLERERERLAQGQPKPEEKPDPVREEERRGQLAKAQEEKRRIEAEMREAVERAQKAREELARAQSAPPQPAPETTVAGIAVVERAEGSVSVVGKAGKRSAAAGESLHPGEGLETAAQSRAVLAYPDSTRVEIAAETAIAELSIEGGKRVVLSKGALAAVVAKQPRGEAMVFRTPFGDATVLGTTLRLAVDPRNAGSTRLDVEKGLVKLTNLAGKTVEVASGHYAVAAAGAEMRATPLPVAVLADDFERSLLTGWQMPIAYPTLWSIVRDSAGKGRVLGGGTTSALRPNEDRYAVSLRCGQDGWTDYAVEASVRFDSPPTDKLCGVLLLARVRDPQNLYWLEYHSLGPSKGLMLFKLSAGKSVKLASTPDAPMPEPGRWYRLRFELQGSRLRGFFDGQLRIEAEDRDFAFGRAGLARADADHVDAIVSWDDVKVERLGTPKK